MSRTAQDLATLAGAFAASSALSLGQIGFAGALLWVLLRR
jgi:hypothetical protein